MSDSEKYPYFARTIESTALRNPAMIQVLNYFNWTKVAIISQNLDYVLPVSQDELIRPFIWQNTYSGQKIFPKQASL